MLITHFHQIIRHRIVWGVIAIVVSLCFLLSFTSMPGCQNTPGPTTSGVGKLYGREIGNDEFRAAMFYELGLSNDRNLTEDQQAQLRRQTWRRLAILETASRLGLKTTNEEIGQMLGRETGFQSNGSFDQDRYTGFVRSRGVDKATFEEYLRQNITIQKALGAVESMAWTAPADLARRLRNLTDTRQLSYLTLDPAQFTGTVSVTEDEARTFYEETSAFFTIPERVRVRYVAFPYANYVPTNLSEEAIQEYYDLHSDEFVAADATNAYALPAPLADVKPAIEERLRVQESRFLARDAATTFVMDLAPDRTGTRPLFEDLAATHGLPVSTTALFAVNEPVPSLDVDHDFNQAAFGLIAEDPELSFSDAIAGSNAAYVITAHERIESRVPPFEEIRNAVMPLATSNAQHEAFLAWAGATREDLVSRSADSNASPASAAASLGFGVATTATFTVLESLNTNLFDNANVLIGSTVEMEAGEWSKLLPASNVAYIVHMTSRLPGDPAMIAAVRPQLVSTLQEYQGGFLVREWGEYLLREGELQDYQQAAMDAAAAAETTDGDGEGMPATATGPEAE
jgi:hypothetical protein